MRGVPLTSARYMRLGTGVLAVAALVACAEPNPQSKADAPVANRVSDPAIAAASAPPGRTPEFAELAGAWRIATVNGTVAVAMTEDGGSKRTPSLSFGTPLYGGTTGCNFFGGVGLLEGDRYFTAPGVSTLIGCGDMTAQEDSITAVLDASPRVSLAADGIVTLTNGQQRLELVRDQGIARRTDPSGSSGLLTNKTVTFRALDGRAVVPPGTTDLPKLSFAGSVWTGRAACATLSCGWRQGKGRIVPVGDMTTTEQLCPPASAAIDGVLAALMKAGPRYAIGPNGEVLIAGGGHWLVGRIER